MITAEQAAQLQNLHRQFIREQIAKGVDGPVPKGRKARSDYNQHFADMEASPADQDAFHAQVRQVLGLPPTPTPMATPTAAAAARHRELQLLGIEVRAAGHDVTPGHEQLHHYWTRGEGLAKWRGSPHPWTTLVALLSEHVPVEKAKRFASKWFIEVFGYAAGSDLHRVESGKPPRGHRIGPG